MARKPKASSLRRRVDLVDIAKKQLKDMKNLSFLRKRTKHLIGERIIERIIERTQDGQGADEKGNPVNFEGYSDKYKKIREKRGLQTGHADLTFDNDMLSGLHIEKLYKNGNLRIAVDAKDYSKAHGAHEGYGKVGHKERPFLGLTEEDKEIVGKDIKGLIEEDYERYLRRKN